MSKHVAPRIAIIGAGPGGLTLARILHLHGLHATVFEREAFSSVRPQGGSLDMHAESGQYAIECAGLVDEFNRIARYEDQEGRLYDKHGKLMLIDDNVTEKNRPGGGSRAASADAAAGFSSVGCCTVGPRVERYPCPKLQCKLRSLVFRNGIKERFDWVVGADGAWSRDAATRFASTTHIQRRSVH